MSSDLFYCYKALLLGLGLGLGFYLKNMKCANNAKEEEVKLKPLYFFWCVLAGYRLTPRTPTLT